MANRTPRCVHCSSLSFSMVQVAGGKWLCLECEEAAASCEFCPSATRKKPGVLVCFIILAVYCTVGISEAQAGVGDNTCEANLQATGQYVLLLKDQRDQYEKEIARLRYQVGRLTEENINLSAKIEKEMKK